MMPDIKDVFFVVGLCLLAGGLAAYDWRLSAVIVGALLMAFGVFGYLWRYGGR